MAIYYHLSIHDNLDEIVKDAGVLKEGQISPRIPDQCHGEDQTPRVCLGPTVWQCILSKPLVGVQNELYIYRINIEKVSEPKGLIGDIETTDEKWITDDDLMGPGNPVKLTRIGKTLSNEEVKLKLKILNKLGKLPENSSEEANVWRTDNQHWELIAD